MNPIQIWLLIGIVIIAWVLFWAGYKTGQRSGITIGLLRADAYPREEDSATISKLKETLRTLRLDHRQLVQHCERLQRVLVFGAGEKAILTEIAEKLRIAAETFGAFRTGKTLQRECIGLRTSALEMAGLLQTIALENAAYAPRPAQPVHGCDTPTQEAT